MNEPVNKKSEQDWRNELTPEQYHILREAGTEGAFTGKYWNNHDKGVYACAGCGEILFESDQKFDSGCGWPSFWDAADKEKLLFLEDQSHGMSRTEVRCANCGGHLGHLFNDGPNPTGLRYCINSASLELNNAAEEKSDRSRKGIS